MLTGWAEVQAEEIVRSGFDPPSGLVMRSTAIRVGRIGATFIGERALLEGSELGEPIEEV